MKSILLSDSVEQLHAVYAKETVEFLQEQAGLDSACLTSEDIRRDPARYREVRYLFSTWGCPAFSEEELAALLPSLECVFYAAGSVQSFARPYLHRGIRVFSAWAANAVPVAEYTTAQILCWPTRAFSPPPATIAGGTGAQPFPPPPSIAATMT